MGELCLVPPQLVAALRLYEAPIPGSWLLIDPWTDVGVDVDPDEALQFLVRAIARMVGDPHAEALVKFLETTWLVFTREFTADEELINVLKTYPGVEADWPKADTYIRAGWNARKAALSANDPQLEDLRAQWAKSFWRQNMGHSICVREGDLGDESESSAAPGDQGHSADDARVAEEVGHAVLTLFNRFLEQATSGAAAPDLWDPAKHEVVSGLVARAVRAVVAVLRSPDLWSDEHGAWVIRLLTETEIILAWLAMQPEEIYRKYQDFGHGKRKLIRRHMQELADRMDDTPVELRKALAHYEKRLGGDWGEEFINVSVGATFADTTVRQMADESGMIVEYNKIYQPASGVTHGEWWAIEDNVMERCMNPLHRFHWIPRLDPPCSVNEAVPWLLAARLTTLVEMALTHLDAKPLEDEGQPSAS